jgi:RNA polymerase sigma-70 factor (ECF subfamily)
MRQPSEPKLYVVRDAPREARREEDDAAIAVGAKRGEAWAAGAVWSRYSGVIRGTLRRSLGTQDVDDHVQEVFLRFFRHANELRDPTALRSFLIGIAFRVAGTELRRRRVRRILGLSSSGEVPSPIAPPLDAEAREGVVRLYAILDRVETDSRLLFTMRYVEGRELTEIAEATGVSLATVKRRISKAGDLVFRMASRDEVLLAYLARGIHAGETS